MAMEAIKMLDPNDRKFDPLGFLRSDDLSPHTAWHTALAHLHAARFHKSATSIAAAKARREHLREACEVLEKCAKKGEWDDHVLLKVRLALEIHDRRAYHEALGKVRRGETHENVQIAETAVQDAVVNALPAGDGEAEIVKEAISKFTAAKGGAPSADEEALVTHKCRWAISLKAFRALRQEISGSIEPKPKPLLVLVNALDAYDNVVEWRPDPPNPQHLYPRGEFIDGVVDRFNLEKQDVELALYYAHQCGELVVSDVDVKGEGGTVQLLATGGGGGGGGYGRRVAGLWAFIKHTHKSRTCGSGIVAMVFTLLTAVCAVVGVAFLAVSAVCAVVGVASFPAVFGNATLCRWSLVLCAVQCAVALGTEDVQYPREKGWKWLLKLGSSPLTSTALFSLLAFAMQPTPLGGRGRVTLAANVCLVIVELATWLAVVAPIVIHVTSGALVWVRDFNAHFGPDPPLFARLEILESRVAGWSTAIDEVAQVKVGDKKQRSYWAMAHMHVVAACVLVLALLCVCVCDAPRAWPFLKHAALHCALLRICDYIEVEAMAATDDGTGSRILWYGRVRAAPHHDALGWLQRRIVKVRYAGALRPVIDFVASLVRTSGRD